MGTGIRAWVLLVPVCLCASVPASAQCPDGAPPPCRAAARGTGAPGSSVAVLYFDSRSRDSNDLYLAEGITEEIITRLAGVERLTVRSRHLVQRYRGTAVANPAEVGRALNVAYLVTGSLRRAGGRLRLSAELIRADGGAQVWGRQFDQAGEDVFAIQEAVASEVATGIVGRLLPGEARMLARRPTQSSAAYEAYLRGNFNLARRDSAGLTRAVREFEAALAADPDYTDAQSRIAVAYAVAHGNGVDLGFPPETLAARALRAADEAVRRAPNSSGAWLATGFARVAAQPVTLAGTREALERAIALDPTDAEPHHLMGFVLGLLGDDSLGLVHDHHALSINPLRPVTIMHLAQYALRRGQYREALRWVDSALVTDQNFGPARASRIPLLMLTGNGDEARRLWDAMEISRSPRLPVSRVAYQAMVPVLEGDTVAALSFLERATPRGAFLRYFMLSPVFDPIRAHPRFIRLLREVSP